MEADLLPDGRTKLILSRREDAMIRSSLLEALPGPVKDDSAFRAMVGVSAEEARSLDEELWITRDKLYDLPRNQSEEERELYLRVKPSEPRKTGTPWDEAPRMEAELLPDGRIAYIFARKELSIFAGAIDAMLEHLAPDKSKGSRTEVWFRVVGAEIEEVEALRDELRRLGREMLDAPPGEPNQGEPSEL